MVVHVGNDILIFFVVSMTSSADISIYGIAQLVSMSVFFHFAQNLCGIEHQRFTCAVTLAWILDKAWQASAIRQHLAGLV